jgi:predicted MPP superfamily phosphohydrolase
MIISIYLFIGIWYDWPKIWGIIICIIIPSLFSIYGFLCPFFTKIEYITLKYKNFKGNKKVICHISDVHLGAIYQKGFSEKIVRLIKDIYFDVLVITGDLCDGSLQVEADWMEAFNSIDKPIIYITGNHEELHGTYKMLKETEKTKIKHILNKNIIIEDINFVCVDYECDFFETLNKIKPLNSPDDIPNVLLAHVPKLKPEDLKDYNIFLFLCGHTHGGQFFPLHIPTYFANTCLWGLYKSKISDNYVFVSQGVGLANIPMRTFSRSVISMITIENDDSIINNENSSNENILKI